MYSIISVANEILRISKTKEMTLTPMHLMKLSYIAFGWYLAIHGEKLFFQRIEAWRYGPVMPDLYHATKKWGKSKIPLNMIDDDVVIKNDEDTINFITKVVDLYKDYDGIGLSALTHQSGTPWDLTYEAGINNKEIPADIIEKHHKSRLVN